MSLKLNLEQQRLFDDHRELARVAARVGKRRFITRDQNAMYQDALIALARCAILWKPGWGSFAGFASQRLRWAVASGDASFAGFRATEDARERTTSFETPVGDTTVEGLAEGSAAHTELQSDPGEARLAGRLHDIREAIKNLKTLTPRERLVLKLRFVFGLDRKVIASRTGISVVTVKVEIRTGVRKLRIYFASLGLKTLPETAPIPPDGNKNGCPRSVR